jgi:hypothetical protein
MLFISKLLKFYFFSLSPVAGPIADLARCTPPSVTLESYLYEPGREIHSRANVCLRVESSNNIWEKN